MGIQSEEAGSIKRISLLNGQSAESTLKTIVKQNTSVISYRKVIADVAKLNGQLVAQNKNSPEMLAKAVVEAGKLGISLDQAKKAADGLLNFQSSIESELEAELLTGKALNLEKARALALDGKSAEAAKEMLRQVGSFSQFSGLNVIQQQSIAKSVGMTADELSNALREQETLNALGKQNKQALQEQYDLYKRTNDVAGLTRLQEEMRSKENGEILLKNIAQASLQQRFEESMEKIKEIFVSIVSGPLMSILNGIAKFLSNTTAVKAALIGSIIPY